MKQRVERKSGARSQITSGTTPLYVGTAGHFMRIFFNIHTDTYRYIVLQGIRKQLIIGFAQQGTSTFFKIGRKIHHSLFSGFTLTI